MAPWHAHVGNTYTLRTFESDSSSGMFIFLEKISGMCNPVAVETGGASVNSMTAKKEGPVSPETLVRFGVALRQARVAAGMTLEQVGTMCAKTTADGKRVVMNKSEVSLIERGLQHSVEFSTLRRLATAVGMDVDLQLLPLPAPKSRRTKKP